MAEIIKINVNTSATKVIINDFNDYIVVDLGDSTLLNRFALLLDEFEELSRNYAQERDAFMLNHGTSEENIDISKLDIDAILEISKIDTDSCAKAIEFVDNFFGEGTVRKAFRLSYENNPNFVPDFQCIYSLLEELFKVLSQLRKEQEKRISKYSVNNRGGNV